jgi:hypothetical protein
VTGPAREAPGAGQPADTPGRRAPEEHRPAGRNDARAVLALGGPVLFTPPALALADRESTVLGVPSLAVYVFAAWLLGIVLTVLVGRRRRERR